MSANPTPLELAERVAEIARGLGIETALIGATALAVHGYVRGTLDIDLASIVDRERRGDPPRLRRREEGQEAREHDDDRDARLRVAAVGIERGGRELLLDVARQ